MARCFAAPAYANSVPLAQFIPGVCPGASVILDRPSHLLVLLKKGSVEAALMPIADLFSNPGLEMIPGTGICARRKVRSVLLKCNRPINMVRTVKLDAASRTSNALALILLRLHWNKEVEVIASGSRAIADATVMIGDKALIEPPAAGGDLDLAAHWYEMTGLPFVFAVWVCRKDHPDKAGLKRIVHAAKCKGVAALRDISKAQARKLGLSKSTCVDYFTTCIYYDIGKREVEAMKLFRKLTARHLSPGMTGYILIPH